MNKLKSILVFPSGSEVALEIERSLRYEKNIKLIGASSVVDHGIVAFNCHTELLPHINEHNFIPELKQKVIDYNIDAIFPAMDSVCLLLKKYENVLGCKILTSSVEANTISHSKRQTYETFDKIVGIPFVHRELKNVVEFPIFAKPDVGYGSRGTKILRDKEELEQFADTVEISEYVFCEYLPGEEYTVDCFTNRHGDLLFQGARVRERIRNGISVRSAHTSLVSEMLETFTLALNTRLKPRGAWFYQVKLDKNSKPKLLEVATRLGGSSAVHRAMGINFAALTIYDAFDVNVQILKNEFSPIVERSLSCNFLIDIDFDTVYVDYDDCIINSDKLNVDLLRFLLDCVNRNKKIILITRHSGDLTASLMRFRLSLFFDEIIHIVDGSPKSQYISSDACIFIDDSFREREDVAINKGIAVFSPGDVVGILL